jgi:hypothetical protein
MIFQMVDQERLPVLAAAQSIYAFGAQLLPEKLSECLKPKLLPHHQISFGESLVFKDGQLIQLIEHKFGLPKLSSFLWKPRKSLQALFAFWKIGRHFHTRASSADVPNLLYSSLIAICVYLNHHETASRVFADEKANSLLVRVRERDEGFYISYHQESGWCVTSVHGHRLATAGLEFKNEHVAIQASLGLMNSWVGITDGRILLSGRIPMLDKFGYVARMVQRSIPRPK